MPLAKLFIISFGSDVDFDLLVGYFLDAFVVSCLVSAFLKGFGFSIVEMFLEGYILVDPLCIDTLAVISSCKLSSFLTPENSI